MSIMRHGIYYSLGATPIDYDPITRIYRYVPQLKCKNAGDDGHVCLMPDPEQYPDWRSDPAYFQGGGEEYDEGAFEALLRVMHDERPDRVYDGLMLNPNSPSYAADSNPLAVIRRFDAIDPRYKPYVTYYNGTPVIPIDTMYRLTPEWAHVDGMTTYGPMIAIIIVTFGAASGAGAAVDSAVGGEVIAGEYSTEALIGDAAADTLAEETASSVFVETLPPVIPSTLPTIPSWLTTIAGSVIKALTKDDPKRPATTLPYNPFLPASTVVDSQPFSVQSLQTLALPALALFALALILKRKRT